MRRGSIGKGCLGGMTVWGEFFYFWKGVMMSKKPARVQFNGGELSPWLYGRADIAKFDKTAKLCRNFIPMAEGCLKRRGGLRFVAQTLADTDVSFKIKAYPAEAEVFINNVKQKNVSVARGEVVYYEVRAEGYISETGQMTVNENTELEINLVSVVEQCVLTINATPQDAKVSIEGYERKSFACHKNAKVFYVVSKPGYVSVSAEVTVDKDMTINVNLVQSETETYNYGDWGKPQAFVSCTAFGDFEVQKKCFMLKFENGYLPILFSIYQNAPDASDINEELFVYEKAWGYDSYARANGIDKITTISSNSDCIYYRLLDGTLYMAFVKSFLMFWGWQLDDNGNYATVHLNYDGSVSGSAIHVYYKGEEVFVMKGRKNG